jgi:tetratricopeptide (TPR) repeat protein
MRRPASAVVLVALALVAGPGAPGAAAAAGCEDWVAVAVSVQGGVHARRAGETRWTPVQLEDTLCPGDMIRSDPRSRAAVVLRTGAVLRLDQGTTLTFSPQTTRERSWVELLSGFVHFVSRVTRELTVLTPFVNGAVEGTEFWIEVRVDQAIITVFEGRVAAANAAGGVAVTSGQSAVALAARAPTLRPVVVTPTDAVQWALYYPPVLDYRPADFPDQPGETWPALIREALEAVARGDLPRALERLDRAPATVRDPRLFVVRAGLLLSVGRLDEAAPDIERALGLDPATSPAVALRAVIAVTRNAPREALTLARRAVALDPRSAAAHVALSYAQQASFELEGALASLQEAVRLRPESALARARLAELWLSLGDLDRALEAAREAARLDPALARTQTVLGFAFLTQIKLPEALEAFERAIRLDQAAPLPRLGLGLAKIRRGDLAGGRRELEIAVSLDPGHSLLRSYLGKAYVEEKRGALAGEQLAIARALDERDPTPPFYDAIRQQSANRPVEAQRDLQRSIDLNDNRAVYRSRLQMEGDLAARGASLARIYEDLGFQQLALVEGWKSLATDPANHSAHRFLADSYSVLPRHDVARVSEVLQAQLLQPLNVHPIPPFLAVRDPFILAGTGPTAAALNEFNSLFERNRVSLRLSGVGGGDGTYGDEVVVSGLWDRFALSLGQFHYATDGFRPNNDLTLDIYDVFTQFSLSAATSVQAAVRRTQREGGDLPLRFDPDNFEETFRQRLRTDSARVGLRHTIAPGSTLLGSFLYEDGEATTQLFGFSSTTHQKAYNPELQYLRRTTRLSLVAGAGYYEARASNALLGRTETRFGNGYAYLHLGLLPTLTATVGASVDSLSTTDFPDATQINPKAGLVWTPLPWTTVRAALFRTLGRPLVSGQSIEPTQVAGFNQLFDDAGLGTETWRYGVAVDQRLPGQAYVGAEIARRDMEVPFLGFDLATFTVTPLRVDWTEDLARAYLYWAPATWLALSAEYRFERLQRDPEFPGPAEVVKSRTHRVPLGAAFFHPGGITLRLRATHVHQDGDFGDPSRGVMRGGDRFWTVDASLAYRLPGRWGLVTLEGRNLLDTHPRFNDASVVRLDSANPTIYPERLVLLRFTLAY